MDIEKIKDKINKQYAEIYYQKYPKTDRELLPKGLLDNECIIILNELLYIIDGLEERINILENKI